MVIPAIYISTGGKKLAKSARPGPKAGWGPGSANAAGTQQKHQCRLGKAAVRAVDFDDSEEAPSGSESDNAGAFDVSQANSTSGSEYESDAGKF